MESPELHFIGIHEFDMKTFFTSIYKIPSEIGMSPTWPDLSEKIKRKQAIVAASGPYLTVMHNAHMGIVSPEELLKNAGNFDKGRPKGYYASDISQLSEEEQKKHISPVMLLPNETASMLNVQPGHSAADIDEWSPGVFLYNGLNFEPLIGDEGTQARRTPKERFLTSLPMTLRSITDSVRKDGMKFFSAGSLRNSIPNFNYRGEMQGSNPYLGMQIYLVLWGEHGKEFPRVFSLTHSAHGPQTRGMGIVNSEFTTYGIFNFLRNRFPGIQTDHFISACQVISREMKPENIAELRNIYILSLTNWMLIKDISDSKIPPTESQVASEDQLEDDETGNAGATHKYEEDDNKDWMGKTLLTQYKFLPQNLIEEAEILESKIPPSYVDALEDEWESFSSRQFPPEAGQGGRRKRKTRRRNGPTGKKRKTHKQKSGPTGRNRKIKKNKRKSKKHGRSRR